MAADFGLVVHAAHGNAREFAAERARDGAAQRGLADAGRPHEAQDGAFQHGLELQDGQVIEDALLHLFQVVVIFVQDLRGAFHVDIRTGGNGPRQAGHPFEVGAGHAVFGRGGRHAGEPVEFAQGLGLDAFGHAGAFELGAQFLDIAVGVVAFAEFLLDGLELLAQVELALVLGQLSLHLGLYPAAQFDEFELARQVAVDLAEPRFTVELLQKVLALGVSEKGQGAGDVIGQAPGFVNVGGVYRELVGEVGRRRDDLLEERHHVLAQGFDFGRDFGFDIGEPLDAGAQEGLGGGELVGPYARDGLAEEQQVILGNLDGLVHDAHGADLKKIFRFGSFHARVHLGNHGEGAVFPERLDEGKRTGASHGDGQERAGVDDSVANREDGKVFEDRDFLGLFGLVGRSVDFGFFDWHMQSFQCSEVRASDGKAVW